jgi:hypothetical protein
MSGQKKSRFTSAVKLLLAKGDVMGNGEGEIRNRTTIDPAPKMRVKTHLLAALLATKLGYSPEARGFEPLLPLRANQFSKLARSAAPPRFQDQHSIGWGMTVNRLPNRHRACSFRVAGNRIFRRVKVGALRP